MEFINHLYTKNLYLKYVKKVPGAVIMVQCPTGASVAVPPAPLPIQLSAQCAWQSSRGWLEYLALCHLSGAPGQSSSLLASACLSPGFLWPLNYWMESLSLDFLGGAEAGHGRVWTGVWAGVGRGLAGA